MALITKDETGTVTRVEFAGCVLETFTQEERVMSDVYADVQRAVVYNVEKDEFKKVYVKAYFELDAGHVTAEVDATDEVKALYESQKAVNEAQSALYHAKELRAKCLDALKAPVIGRKVKVVRGRKVPLGTTGVCAWIDTSAMFGPRVKIQDAEGKFHWTSVKNVEAVI